MFIVGSPYFFTSFSTGLYNLAIDEIVEVPKDMWSGMIVFCTEGELPDRTYRQWMNENYEPDIIAGTMYD